MRMSGGPLAVGAVALLLLCTAPSSARAGNLAWVPPCGNEPPWGLYPTYAPDSAGPDGFDYTFDHHRLTVSQTSPTLASPPSNFELLLARKTTITGDFVATVVATRLAISHAQMGLLVNGPPPVPNAPAVALIDLVLGAKGAISSTLWGENSVGRTTSATDPRATIRLKIWRKRNVLSVSYDGQTKKASFPSSPENASYGQPVTINILFNVDPPFAEPQSGTFKRFSIWSADLGDKCPK